MMPRTALALLTALSIALPMPAAAKSCFRGINISGAEFGNRGGVVGTDYTWPSDQTLAYFADKGFGTVRIAFKWERLQPVLFGPLDEAELNRLREAVGLARSHGLTIILNPHNYARYDEQTIGSQTVPVEAFADFWARLAAEYRNDKDIRFGLVNEPNRMDTSVWLAGANAALAAIRGKAKANNIVLVPGNSWTGAHSWFNDLPGGSNAETMAKIVDPANRSVYEVHQYLDSDFSGTHRDCPRADDAVKALENFTIWLRSRGARGYLGEFGGSNDPGCLAGLAAMVAVVEANPDVWTGWAYWVAGDWWPADEALNIQPVNGEDRPQLASLKGSRPVSELPACD